jgi:hypothetical protein
MVALNSNVDNKTDCRLGWEICVKILKFKEMRREKWNSGCKILTGAVHFWGKWR